MRDFDGPAGAIEERGRGAISQGTGLSQSDGTGIFTRMRHWRGVDGNGVADVVAKPPIPDGVVAQDGLGVRAAAVRAVFMCLYYGVSGFSRTAAVRLKADTT